jgi:transcriptional regulator with XRE-family HTH domain
VVARAVRARGLVAEHAPSRIAADIFDECSPEFGTSWVRAYRLAQGIALADVAAQIKAWYESEGRPTPRFSETLLSAYESGQKRPGPEYLHYLCRVYRADPGDLGFVGACLCGHSHRQGALATVRPGARPAGNSRPGPADRKIQAGRPVPADCPAAWPGRIGQPSSAAAGLAADGPEAAAAGAGLAAGAGPAAGAVQQAFPAEQPDVYIEDDDDLMRRTLLRLIAHPGSPVTGTFFGAADRIRRRMDDALVSGSVSATMLDQWEETAAGYGRQYMSAPPRRLLCDVLLDVGDVRRMCEQRQPLEFTERLCRLAAQLSGLAGMILIDIGDQRLARGFFRTARSAADETGDRHLRGWVAVREALVPLYYGDPAESMALARAGADLAGTDPSVAAVMAKAVEARSLARLSARRTEAPQGRTMYRAMSMLGRAHEMLTRLPDRERDDTAFGYTERQFLFHEGDAMITLRHHLGAEKALTRSHKLYSATEVLDRSLVSLGLAHCRLEEDEPEEALRISRDTLFGLPREHRTEIVVHEARSLCRTVAGRHGEFPAVRECREALATA